MAGSRILFCDDCREAALDIDAAEAVLARESELSAFVRGIRINREQFIASPGWAVLFDQADAAIETHELESLGSDHVIGGWVHPASGICLTAACCEVLRDALLQVERLSVQTCQACGEAGEPVGALVECPQHRGGFPYRNVEASI